MNTKNGLVNTLLMSSWNFTFLFYWVASLVRYNNESRVIRLLSFMYFFCKRFSIFIPFRLECMSFLTLNFFLDNIQLM